MRKFEIGDEVVPLPTARIEFGFGGVVGEVYTILECDEYFNYRLSKKASHWVRGLDIVLKSSLILELL
jgi:hypothetical protein